MSLCASAQASDTTPSIQVAAGDPPAADFLIVDDFESYTDDEENRWPVFWIDPYMPQYAPWPPIVDPLCERRVVHSGKQSLALDYDDSCEPYYTGLERTWDDPMDWATDGFDTLVLYVHGQVTNDPGSLSVTVQDTAGKSFTVVHPDPNAVRIAQWFEWRIQLDEKTLAGVSPRRVKRLTICVGDRSGSESDGSGRIYVDDIMVVRADTFPWLEGSERSYPRDADVNIPQSLVLSWSIGEGAAFHDVYFGQDANAVADASPATSGIYRSRLARDWNRFDPGPLDWGKTYFWRIDEVNEVNPVSPVKGEVWRFTTADFLVIDDFERYTDDEGERIYEYWIDGPWTGNGSLIGYTCAPYAPHPILVHSGRQDMPFRYANSSPPYYSEAYRSWETPQDWTIQGGAELSLWLHGAPASFIEYPDNRFLVNGLPGDAEGKSETYCFVCKQLAGDGEIVARVDSLSDAQGWARAGVMIRNTRDYGVPFVAMTVTADHGVSFAYRVSTKTDTVRIGVAGVQTPHWVKLTRTGSVATPRYSADGVTWLDVKDEKGRPVTATIEMPKAVQIGLCAISGDWQELVQAEFSAVAVNGDIQGPWLTTDVDGCNISEVNCRDDLYVALEDAAGRKATSFHPDPTAVNVNEWTQWRIPLTEFTADGVDVTMVMRMYIGVGNRDNPQLNGAGMIQIDDIHVLKP